MDWKVGRNGVKYINRVCPEDSAEWEVLGRNDLPQDSLASAACQCAQQSALAAASAREREELRGRSASVRGVRCAVAPPASCDLLFGSALGAMRRGRGPQARGRSCSPVGTGGFAVGTAVYWCVRATAVGPARPAAVASLSLRARTFSYSFYVKSSS